MHGGKSTVPLLESASTQPCPETLNKIHRAYSLRSELDSCWGVRPPGSSDLVAQMAFQVEDPGGEALDGSLAGRKAMTLFIDLNANLATGQAMDSARNARFRQCRSVPFSFQRWSWSGNS